MFIVSVFLLTTFLFAGCNDVEHKPDKKGIRPIVFVHGMSGSGDQFETQALRFASNGYPEDYFTGFDHNTIRDPDRLERLDATIDAVLAEDTGPPFVAGLPQAL